MRLLPDPELRERSRSGMALVVVLGFLTVLVIIGIAFVIVMRTERLASRAFADVVRARFIAEAGLAQALSDLDQALAASGTYPTFNTDPAAPDLFHSRPGATEDLLIDPEAIRFAPMNVATNRRLVGWREIRDPINNRALGRYCYLIINSSGLLDINHAGGTNRAFGVRPSEIQLNTNFLRELTPDGATQLATARDSRWIRFESLPDLLALGRNNTAFNFDMLNPGVTQITNMFIFSYAPAGWLDSSGTPRDPVYVGSNFVPAQVRLAFESFSAAASSADALRDSLIDYTDADFIPTSVLNFTTEPTPLINEIAIVQRFVNGTNQARARVEFAFPFIRVTNSQSYHLTLLINFAGATPAEYNPGNIGAGWYGATAVITPPSGTWQPHTYAVVDLPWVSGASTNPLLQLAMTARVARAELRQGPTSAGPLVDLLNSNLLIDMSFATTSPNESTGGVAVVDMRLNYDVAHWRQVNQSQLTLGTFNHTIIPNSLLNEIGRSRTNIYIANRPLRNTGELGMLFSGSPWRPIPIFGSDAWPILHRFSVFTNRTHRGRINVNTTFTNVLASALLGASLDLDLADPALTNAFLSVQQARSVAHDIYMAIYGGTGDPLVNIGELGERFPGRYFPSLLSGTINSTIVHHASAAVLRNTADLLTTRQQIFTAFIAGDAYDQNGNVSARRRLVAVIWRDPYPNPSGGPNEWFIRFFKWLGPSD